MVLLMLILSLISWTSAEVIGPCDEDTVLNTTEEYYSCIDKVYHNLSVNILNHQAYPGVSLDHIYDLFCDGMEDVMSSCIWTQCYGPKDVIEKRNENLRLLQSVISFHHFLVNTHKSQFDITDFH